MARTSISLPDEVQDEVDDRRHSTTSRSEYIREALAVRFLLEMEGEWESQLTQAERDPVGSGQDEAVAES